MAGIGNGYGSECHLLRYLGRHRTLLNSSVLASAGGQSVEWLDVPFDARRRWLDGEWAGLDFLPDGSAAHRAWTAFWPQRGNPPNWYAVGRLSIGGQTEWLLVEAKAHLRELESTCQAKPEGGRRQIKAALDRAKQALGVSPGRDWLNGYYQFCNRVAVLTFLAEQGVPSRLVFIYFVGDRSGPGRVCPATFGEWGAALAAQESHVGLPAGHRLANRIHKLFLPVCPTVSAEAPTQ